MSRTLTIFFSVCNLFVFTQVAAQSKTRPAADVTAGNGLRTDMGKVKLGGALTDALTTINFNPDSVKLVLGNVNANTLTGKGILIGYKNPIHGTINVYMADRNFLYGNLTATAGENIRGGTNFGRLNLSKTKSDVINFYNDSIEIGLANVIDTSGGSYYTNIYNGIRHDKKGYFQDIQRFVTRYFPAASVKGRSFIEMTHFTNPDAPAEANNIFINSYMVQLNYMQPRQQHEGGDTASGGHVRLSSNGLQLYWNGQTKSSIDTAGKITAAAFAMPAGARKGNVLTTDEAGNASWQNNTYNIRRIHELSYATVSYGTTVKHDTLVVCYVFNSGKGPASFKLDTNAPLGTEICIKDGMGTAAENSIAVDSGNNCTIDGRQQYAITKNYESASFKKIGRTQWIRL